MSALERSEAVRHRGGPLVVTGAAGTGKTRLIADRFLWLVEGGTEPSRIAVVAPSSGRAEALRERLETELTRGYEELLLGRPVDLAAAVMDRTGTSPDGSGSLMGLLAPGDRLAMLMERLDQLELSHHDFAGSPAALLGQFVRRIDRLKAELISAEEFAAWAATVGGPDGDSEREFAGVYGAHEALLAQAAAHDAGDLILGAVRVCEARGQVFEHVLVDDAQELDFAAARLVRVLGRHLSVAGDPAAGLTCLRGAGQARMGAFAALERARLISLEHSFRCAGKVREAASLLIGSDDVAGRGGGDVEGRGGGEVAGRGGGEVAFWRCENRRAQAQAVAADIERLLAREGLAGGEIVVIVPDGGDDGRSVAAALEERAVAHRLVGEAAFFQRAEIRDLLAWLRLLVDPTDAAAGVRVLARPPVELRSVDIARCTQIARRRKLDMVAALAAATESPQVPPEARERIRSFLKLYRAAMPALDNTRPEVFVHRLIERLGLRRQQLFAAQADVVERLQALARFSELAAAYGRRAPQSTPREFAHSIAAVAQFGLPEQEDPRIVGARTVQIVPLTAAGGIEAEHVYLLGLHGGLRAPAPERVPDALLKYRLPAASDQQRAVALRQALYVALSRARTRVVLCRPAPGPQATPQVAPAAPIEKLRNALGAVWEEKPEELFGPAETLHSTYRLLRDDLLDATMRVGGRLGELRLDTDLDISHAVVRYLELLKVAALVARPEQQSLAEALRDVNARILQAATAEQKEILSSSALDEYLLDSEWDMRRRAQMLAARDEPSLEPFLPRRGEGIALSASDIDTYRTCPLRYKFARVFRIPQEPSVHQRFGIVVHQVLERFHARTGTTGTLPELLGLLDSSWRRAGFADSEEERQLRGKAASALMRYHARFQAEEARPVWFERPFTFRLGPHILRGRVDRVDRLPGGRYELIDYKTGRPKSSNQLADDVQLSVYAVGAREAWQVESPSQAYYYLLDDEKVALPEGGEDRSEWVREVAREVAEGVRAQEFEPTPSFAACSVCDYRLLCPAAEV